MDRRVDMCSAVFGRRIISRCIKITLIGHRTGSGAFEWFGVHPIDRVVAKVMPRSSIAS